MSGLPWLDPFDDEQPFPDPEHALREPDGLLAIGGSLNPGRLLRAYRQGIFPWYCSGQPILWWSPDPRTVLFPERIRISRSLRKVIRKNRFRITTDTCFATVMERCSEPRGQDPGTWITPEMHAAYRHLHHLGHAHCVETWQDEHLVGGLYGVAIGRVFFGESMFSRVSNASKIALVALVEQLRRWEFALIDCQMHTEHLARMGARRIPRPGFTRLLRRSCDFPGRIGDWHFDDDIKTVCPKITYESRV